MRRSIIAWPIVLLGLLSSTSRADDWGWLTVQTQPSGLAFEVDGRTAITTDRIHIWAGDHVVRLADHCYEQEPQHVAIQSGQSVTVTLAARPRFAWLSARALDEQQHALTGTLEIDGEPVGQVPGKYMAWSCARSATLRLADGRRLSVPLELIEGLVTPVEFVSHEVPAPPKDDTPLEPPPPPAPSLDDGRHHQHLAVDADLLGRYEARWGFWFVGSPKGGVGLDAGIGAGGAYKAPDGFVEWGLSLTANLIFSIPLAPHVELVGGAGLGYTNLPCSSGERAGPGGTTELQSQQLCEQYFRSIGRTDSSLAPVYMNTRLGAQLYWKPVFVQAGWFYHLKLTDDGTQPPARTGPTVQVGYVFH